MAPLRTILLRDITTANTANQARGHGGCGTPLPRWVRIFVASVMLTTAVAAVVTHDLLELWNTQARLELDAAEMAEAGVAFLPNAPARATLAAAHSARLCGLSRAEVVRCGAAVDRMSFNVTLRRTAPVLVFQLLGSAGVDVTVTVRVRPSAAPGNSDDGSIVLSALRRSATRFEARAATTAL